MGRAPHAGAHKPMAGNPAVAAFRARIYQTLLGLLEAVDKLSPEILWQADGYGLDWHGLARPVVAHYKSDLFHAIQVFQDMVMSKEGARDLPKGLYRNLLDFLERCAEFLRAARGPDFEEAAARLSPAAPAAEREANPFLQACGGFKKACLEMRQHICIFENERPAAEESFFA
jgi:hypothetical protein